MTTITITGKKPGKTDVTISSTVNPAVKTIVPVTVKSRNLLAYGPASANGLTATVNSDGSLHVTGTASRQWAGLSWTFPCPVQGIVTLSASATIKGLDVNTKCLDGNGQQLGSQITMTSRGLRNPRWHRQPAPLHHKQRGHTHRTCRRPQNPARIRNRETRLDAPRQHKL